MTEPLDIGVVVVDYLGQAVAKVHCVGDSDADHTLVPFQTERAIEGWLLAARRSSRVGWRGSRLGYDEVARADHRLFVEAFRHGELPV